MSQAERRGRLHCSKWPDLDWENDWVMLTEFDDFDRSISMDARSGKLQSVFDIPYNGPYDVDTPRTTVKGQISLQNVDTEEDAKEYLRQVKDRSSIDKETVKDWSVQWRLT
jgi:hypothetical protein